jgi:hypothetical protein
MGFLLLSPTQARAEYGAGMDGFSLQWTPSRMLEVGDATTTRRPSVMKLRQNTASQPRTHVAAKRTQNDASRKHASRRAA